MRASDDSLRPMRRTERDCGTGISLVPSGLARMNMFERDEPIKTDATLHRPKDLHLSSNIVGLNGVPKQIRRGLDRPDTKWFGIRVKIATRKCIF